MWLHHRDGLPGGVDCPRGCVCSCHPHPVLITEAMKMETEIQAPVAGKVTAINVSKGDTVNPDETLIEIDTGT